MIALADAARDGDFREVKHLLRTGVNPTARVWNWSIKTAAENGHTEVVRELLKYPGADPTAGGTHEPIKIAAENGHTEVVKELLKDARTDPTAGGTHEPIMDATNHGHFEVVEELLKHPHIDPTGGVDGEHWPLIGAAMEGRTELVKKFLAHPRTDPNGGDTQGPLVRAAEEGQTDVVKILLNDPRVDPTDGGHNLPVKFAAYRGNTEVIKELLRHPNVGGLNEAFDEAISHKKMNAARTLARDPRTNLSGINDNTLVSIDPALHKFRFAAAGNARLFPPRPYNRVEDYMEWLLHSLARCTRLDIALLLKQRAAAFDEYGATYYHMRPYDGEKIQNFLSNGVVIIGSGRSSDFTDPFIARLRSCGTLSCKIMIKLSTGMNLGPK